MSAYTPTTDEVRGSYAVFGFRENRPIVDQHQSVDEWKSEFNRWLDAVKADAWDEGYGLGVEVGHRGDDHWEPNPYRTTPTEGSPS